MTTNNFITYSPDALKKLRVNAGISQLSLAKLAGIREATYIDIEKGRTNPTIKTLTAIFEVLKCDLSITPKH